MRAVCSAKSAAANSERTAARSVVAVPSAAILAASSETKLDALRASAAVARASSVASAAANSERIAARSDVAAAKDASASASLPSTSA